MQFSAHQKIAAATTNRKLRASAYKLYRWVCWRTDGNTSLFARLDGIRKATGLSKEAIINGRRELERVNLIRAQREGGPEGGYYFTVLNADHYLQLDWSRKPLPRYFRIPYASLLSTIYPEKWTGTDALIYDELSMRMSRAGKNELPLMSHWFKAVSKNTLSAREKRLAQTGFIRVKNRGQNRVIEILNPETSQSMPPKGADQEPTERAYYIDRDTGARRLLNEEDFTPEVFETYFRKSLPRTAEWSPGHNAHCHSSRLSAGRRSCEALPHRLCFAVLPVDLLPEDGGAQRTWAKPSETRGQLQ